MTEAPRSSTESLTRRERYGTAYAALVVQGVHILAERYGNASPSFVHDDTPVTPDTALHSWSIAKSVLHAGVGVLVGDGRLTLHVPAAVPEWSEPDDPRRTITLDQMLAMRDGLDFLEDYVNDTRSDVIDMLFGSGQHDVPRYAADRPLAHEPGTVFNYSSGTSNIVSRLRARPGRRHRRVPAEPRTCSIRSVWTPRRYKCDDAGTFIGSSYVYATARDWVKFGQCYLHDGVSNGRQASCPRDGSRMASPRAPSIPPTDARTARTGGASRTPRNSLYASGYEGQRILACPELDLIAVRFGRSTSDQYDTLADWSRDVVAACG